MEFRMYTCKTYPRQTPKVSLPIRLDDQCLNTIVLELSKAAEKVNNGRNSREKKSFRDYLYHNMPISLQDKILKRAADKLIGVETTLDMYDMMTVENKQVSRKTVDLLGPYRYEFGCHDIDNRRHWSVFADSRFDLTLPQCNQLYNLLLWSKLEHLEELAFSVENTTLKQSNLPNMLGRASSLTKITLLCGADNHILRIFGVNCPFLRHMDLTNSFRVTDEGLYNLFLKRPRQLKNSGSILLEDNSEKTSCARTILSITLNGTGVTIDGCEFACRVINFGYFSSFEPVTRIVRMDKGELCDQGVHYDVTTSTFNLRSSSASNALKAVIATGANNALPPELLVNSAVDYYKQEIGAGFDLSFVFVRQASSFRLNLFIRIDSRLNHVTSLFLPWYSYDWRLDFLLELDTLGISFPHLRKFRGRVQGIWNSQKELLPSLHYAYVWSPNNATGLSFLQGAPSLVVFEFNHISSLDTLDTTAELSDANLETSLENNTGLVENLKEITIRPSKLTLRSLKSLITKCVKLVRIGDLETWRVTKQEVDDFKGHLDSVRSQCILSFLDFPPSQHYTDDI